MFHRGTYVWGGILILVGILLFLSNLGILVIDVWKVIVPSIVILIGILTIWGTTRPTRELEARSVQLPLEGAARAALRLRFGAGRLALHGGASAASLLDGTFRGGVESQLRRSGSEAQVDLRVPSDFILNVFSPWMWWSGHRLEWDMSLAESIPVSLDVETGASEAVLDLTRLMVDELRLSSGASSCQIRMPAGVSLTKARIESGAASLDIVVPDGVSAQIRVEGGLAGVRVNAARFPKVDKIYRSPDYDTAAKRLDLRIEAGVASVDVN
jgi:hypothetical protein